MDIAVSEDTIISSYQLITAMTETHSVSDWFRVNVLNSYFVITPKDQWISHVVEAVAKRDDDANPPPESPKSPLVRQSNGNGNNNRQDIYNDPFLYAIPIHANPPMGGTAPADGDGDCCGTNSCFNALCCGCLDSKPSTDAISTSAPADADGDCCGLKACFDALWCGGCLDSVHIPSPIECCADCSDSLHSGCQCLGDGLCSGIECIGNSLCPGCLCLCEGCADCGIMDLVF